LGGLLPTGTNTPWMHRLRANIRGHDHPCGSRYECPMMMAAVMVEDTVSLEGNSDRQDRSIVLGPGEGTVAAGSAGTPTVVKLHGEDVRGAYSLMELEVAPGPGAGPHVHHQADEAFYVVDGEMLVQLGDRTVHAPKGSFILVPRGLRHAFANAGSTPARAVFICSPPGFERFFEELAALRRAAPSGQLDAETVAEIGRKYATEFW